MPYKLRLTLPPQTKILINNQLYTPPQAEKWANDEYKTLPKCAYCRSILGENLYQNSLHRNHFYCGVDCADADYFEALEKIKEEEEEYECL